MEIVLVGAKRFCNVALSPNPIEMGDVLTVNDESKAEALLANTTRDKADHEHPMFLPKDDIEGIQYYLEGWPNSDEPDKPARQRAAPKKKPPVRKARAK